MPLHATCLPAPFKCNARSTSDRHFSARIRSGIEETAYLRLEARLSFCNAHNGAHTQDTPPAGPEQRNSYSSEASDFPRKSADFQEGPLKHDQNSAGFEIRRRNCNKSSSLEHRAPPPCSGPRGLATLACGASFFSSPVKLRIPTHQFLSPERCRVRAKREECAERQFAGERTAAEGGERESDGCAGDAGQEQ